MANDWALRGGGDGEKLVEMQGKKTTKGAKRGSNSSNRAVGSPGEKNLNVAKYSADFHLQVVVRRMRQVAASQSY